MILYVLDEKVGTQKLPKLEHSNIVVLKFILSSFFHEEFKELPRRPNRVDKDYIPQRLYNDRLKIPERKLQHLQELKSVIPIDCRAFYENLPH